MYAEKSTMNPHRIDTLGVSTIATVLGWIGGQVLALILAIPLWMMQLSLAVMIAATTTTVTHFLKRWLNRRWPDRKRRPGDSAE
jgi:uncharacterized membrane protein YeiH